MSVNFDEIKKKLDENETKEKKFLNWADNKEFWSLKQKALLALQSLYEKLGGEQFMKLAGSAILTDPGYCDPNLLFDLLPNAEALISEYDKEIAEFNRKFLSKHVDKVTPEVHGCIIEYLVESIGEGNISKELVDAIRLHPDSTLFSKENIEAYGESLKNGDWTKDDKPLEQMRDEALHMANEFMMNNNYYNAVKLYKNVIEMSEDNNALLLDSFFKIILCHIESGSKFKIDFDMNKFSKKYPIFKDSKQYTYLQIARNICVFSFDRELKTQNINAFQEATNKYFEENNVTDPLITTMLLKIKNRYI